MAEILAPVLEQSNLVAGKMVVGMRYLVLGDTWQRMKRAEFVATCIAACCILNIPLMSRQFSLQTIAHGRFAGGDALPDHIAMVFSVANHALLQKSHHREKQYAPHSVAYDGANIIHRNVDISSATVMLEHRGVTQERFSAKEAAPVPVVVKLAPFIDAVMVVKVLAPRGLETDEALLSRHTG